MKLEEHKELIRKMQEGQTDTTVITEGLISLSDDYAAITAERADLDKKIKELEMRNAKLVEANGALFLRVTNSAPSEHKEPDGTPKKRNFDDLFDEKGNLK